MLPPPKTASRNGTIISAKLHSAYERKMEIVEQSHGEIAHGTAEYWWALYEIKRDNLWRAKYAEGKFKDWLMDIRRERFGPSKSDYYMVMGTIERLMRGGLTEDDVKPLLGKLTTALKGDLKELFERNGKGELKSEIAEQLESDGEDFPEFVERLTELGAGEARTQVSRLLSREHVFATEADYDERIGRLMINFRWESDEDGLMWAGTVTMTGAETTSPKRYKGKPAYMPSFVANYIIKRLGITDED